MSHESDTNDTPNAADQTTGPAVGGQDQPVAAGAPLAGSDAEQAGAHDGGGNGASAAAGKSKAVAVAAGAGAAVAGLAGGIAVAARDTRRRVLGVPVGTRSGLQRGASAVVDRVQEPARRLGSRFSRD